MGRGGHRGGAEDEPRLLVESVGVGVAGVGAGDDLGGHRSSGEGELGARVCGEVRGVHGWTQRSVVSALDTVRWPGARRRRDPWRCVRVIFVRWLHGSGAREEG